MEKSSNKDQLPFTVTEYFSKLPSIEQPFADLVPEWIYRMHSHFHDGKALGKRYEQKLKSSYSNCFIGDLRDKLGLSRNYYGKASADRCSICMHWAISMACSKTREDYEDALDQIKVHMEVDHHLQICN